MRKLFIISVLFVVFFSSCNEKENKIPQTQTKQEQVSESEYSVSGVLWYQTSSEAKALYYQSFNLAKMMLDKNLKESKNKKKKAVITDIDETILNNSPYNARLAKSGNLYTSEGWDNWVKAGVAKALPGAVDFCNYAQAAGIEIFYVSNRTVRTLDVTIQNMKNEGFPFTEAKYFLLKSSGSDKTARRDSILMNYDVILYMGDNLRDFSEDFGHRKENFGEAAVNENSEMFGTKFIVFPNPMYGEWEKAVYNDDWSTPDNKKDSLRKAALRDNY